MKIDRITLTTEKQYIKRDFQSKIEQFLLEGRSNKRVLIVDAPTGAGKTHTFKRLDNSEGVTFLVLPNNYLIEEKYEEFLSSGLIRSSYLKKLSREDITHTIEEEGLGKDNDPHAILTAIDYIISNSKLIITNPSIVFLILYNHYWERYYAKGSHLSNLITKGLVNIIFDEIHIYDKDQRNRIIALNSLLYENVKFGYTSATIPSDLIKTLFQVFGEERVEYIKVTTTEPGESSNLLRGPIKLDIFNSEIFQLNEELLEELKYGNWIIILNKIVTINKFYKFLLEHNFPNSDILLVSGYHSKSRETLNLFKEGKARIMIASNIIEQGINPPKNYTNFIIEPGYYNYSLVQRIGRVGRGIEEESHVFIPIPDKVIPRNIENLKDLNVIIDSLASLLRKGDESPIDFKSLGYYIGNFISITRFDEDHRNKFKEVIGKLNGSNEIIEAIESFDKIDRIIVGKKMDKCITMTPEKIKNIYNWWNSYNLTFKNFIKSESIIELIDESLKDSNNLGLFSTYNEMWVLINKEIIRKENGKLVVGEDREDPFKEFHVTLINVPFEEYGPRLFKEIEWKERDIIMDNLKRYYDVLLSCPTTKSIYQFLKEYLFATGWIDRIIYKVYEGQHNGH